MYTCIRMYIKNHRLDYVYIIQVHCMYYILVCMYLHVYALVHVLCAHERRYVSHTHIMFMYIHVHGFLGLAVMLNGY